MKNYYSVFLLIIFLTVTACSTCYFFLKNNIPLFVCLLVISLGLLYYLMRIIYRLYRDMENFVEAVRYRDFSKKYVEKKSLNGQFYHYFNDMTRTFISISREKETQQQYLKKILELVDTGILAYNTETNDTLWVNESLKNTLKIPYIKNINWLKARYETLYNELIEIPLGESRLITLNTGYQTVKMLSNACTFETGGQTYKLIAFHNINATLEEVEAGAWKGLLEVMTHEIMNSIAPVASLADTMKKRIEVMKQELKSEAHPEMEDIELAMETIRRRSEGLLKFAETYRNLSKTIVLHLTTENLKEVVNDIYQLMHPSLKQKGILFEINVYHPSLVVSIDRSLIEQVLINFITNATHAVNKKENSQIIIYTGVTEDGNAYLTVADNGCGIAPDVRDKIFIPFFSTRKNGNGIGLSLSREIVKLHKGSLQVQSKENEGSAFTIIFNTPVEPLT